MTKRKKPDYPKQRATPEYYVHAGDKPWKCSVVYMSARLTDEPLPYTAHYSAAPRGGFVYDSHGGLIVRVATGGALYYRGEPQQLVELVRRNLQDLMRQLRKKEKQTKQEDRLNASAK